MEQYIITIDGGTTNTRCILWNGKRKKIAEQKRSIGVRNTAIDGNNCKLKQAVKDCLENLLKEADLDYSSIYRIIASGMITSDVGIVEVPHKVAPLGMKELAQAIVKKEIPEVAPIPIYFIPGIKNQVFDINIYNYETMDIMRGEETESIALIHRFFRKRPMLLILPGSHNKFVTVDHQGRITGCLTSISGELLASITQNTILTKSVGGQFVSEKSYDKEWVLRGYKNAYNTGLGRACFSGRILNLFGNVGEEKIANYILGASIAGDIYAVKNSRAICIERNMDVIVAGKEPLSQAIADILNEEKNFGRIEKLKIEEDRPLSAVGAYLVAENSEIL